MMEIERTADGYPIPLAQLQALYSTVAILRSLFLEQKLILGTQLKIKSELIDCKFASSRPAALPSHGQICLLCSPNWTFSFGNPASNSQKLACPYLAG